MKIQNIKIVTKHAYQHLEISLNNTFHITCDFICFSIKTSTSISISASCLATMVSQCKSLKLAAIKLYFQSCLVSQNADEMHAPAAQY